MSELYWLDVLGNQHDFCVILAALAAFAFLALFFLWLNSDDYYEFSPSNKKNLLIIYGVGGTIDYVKENKVANKIPDKCIKALDKYLDDVLKEDKDDCFN